jgi:hypothetical protein
MQESTSIAEVAATPTPVFPEVSLQVIVTEPGQMAIAQQDLIAWCDRKIASLEGERAEGQEAYEVARAAKWKSSTLKAVTARLAKRILYYQKIQEALRAGYVVVPNFPEEIFAVRTNRKPDGKVRTQQWKVRDMQAGALPIGEGSYVSSSPMVEHRAVQLTRDDKPRTEHQWLAVDTDEVEFPVALAHPAVLSATAKAMSRKLFDEMGIVRQASGDPIVVGRIVDPTRGGSMRSNQRRMSFFVAWWLREADL